LTPKFESDAQHIAIATILKVESLVSWNFKHMVNSLKMAIKSCTDTNNLIYHSDRGVQYCCADYVNILENKTIKISMTENGDPLENALAERVNGRIERRVVTSQIRQL